MSLALAALTEQALALPNDERAALAETLFGSLGDHGDQRINTWWAVEAERRIAAFDRGELVGVPADELLRSLEDEET